MQDISIYFSPSETVQEFDLNESALSRSIGKIIETHTANGFPQMEKGGVALIYVPEYRKSNYSEVLNEKFRKHLYTLAEGSEWKTKLYDLGTILPGEKVEDTYFALAQVVYELVKNQIIPIIIGGSQDLTIAMYNGYEKLEQLVNLCTIDSKLDLGNPDHPFSSDGYISHLLMQRPCYLFNHANIGLQAPFCSKEELDLFEKLYFDYCRLGEFNSDFKKAEPLLRNSDILSIDFTSLRYSELVDKQYDSPNGFYADQMCQMAKYAGLSDKLTSLGVFNYLPEKSDATNYSNCLAQMIWYFIDGVNNRKGDFPIGSKKDYLRFTIHLDDFKDELVFYKSNKSERWWMEVPYPSENGKKFDRHHLVPCDQTDYEKSMKNDIPNLWWKTFQKLS